MIHMAKAKYIKNSRGEYETKIWDGTYNTDGSKHRKRLVSKKSSADLERQVNQLKNDVENVVLTIPVSNVGQRDGEEVVQVYLRRPGDKEGPHYTLRAFKRVHIPAGKTESVAIPLTGENFEWFDAESNTMRPLEGTYELLYGGTSDRNKLKTIVMNVQ